MKHYWYSLFLSVSLVFSMAWTCTTKAYERNEYTAVEAAEQKNTEEEQIVIVTSETEDVSAMDLEEENQETEAETEEMETEVESEVESEAETEEAEPEFLFPENFQDVLLIGDSRTVGLHEYGQLGEADVFATSGMSVFDLWKSEVTVNKQKTTLSKLLSERKYQTIHIMLGINELGYSMDQIVEKYRAVIEEIQEMQPQAKLVLGANLHVTGEKSASSSIYNNKKIDELNGKIESIGRELLCEYVDINEKFDDENGNLAKEYTADGSHIMGKHYADWVQWLREK